MYRVIGALLIVVCTAVLGFGGVLRLGRRVRNLTGLVSALEIMKGEICERLTPMPELFELLAGTMEGPVAGLFQACGEQMTTLGESSMYLIWKSAVRSAEELELSEQEARTLTEVGHVLGRYDAEEQRTAISFAIRRMEGCLHRAEEEKRAQTKVRAALGVTAGLFVVIILL